MFTYDFEGLNTFLKGELHKNLTGDAWKWLENEGESIRAKGELSKFNIAFVAMPRKTGKKYLDDLHQGDKTPESFRPHLSLKGWSADRLARVWLLMQVNPENKDTYVATIENLFLNAEMGELVALYSSLPLLAYPEAWRKRCAEGIRSSIGQVLEAVICDNPYPSEQLDEAAWNQLVLKAIFTEKPILAITGLKERANLALAQSLLDYVHERWAAHRAVNPLLWICVSPFIDENNFSDIQRLFSSADTNEREAAALAAYNSSYDPARKMVQGYPGLLNDIESGKISWESVAAKMEKADQPNK